MPYPIRENLESESAEELKFSVRKLMVIAMLMAGMAGYINSAMLIEFGMPVSQMTGITSRLSDATVHSDWSELFDALMILSGFLLGAFLSGLIIGKKQYYHTPDYGHALLLNSTILGLATLFSFIQSEFSVFLSAVACGLQNALVSSYRGQQLRTTHMTGIVTDLGVYLAHKFKNRAAWPWQANLLLVLLISFLIGGIIGIFAYRQFPNWSLIAPCLLNAVLAVLYLKNYHQKHPDA